MSEAEFGAATAPAASNIEHRVATLEMEVAQLRGQLLAIDRVASNAEWAVNSATRTQANFDKFLEQLAAVQDETGLRIDRLALKAFAYMRKMDEIEARRAKLWDRLATIASVFFCVGLFVYWLLKQ